MKSNAITVLIDTDEQTAVPCRVEYDFQSFLMRDAKIGNLHRERIATQTPQYVIDEQIKAALCLIHGQVEFI